MFKPVSKMNENMQNAVTTATIQKFDYDGSPIAFATGENVMVNATQMAKKFGKRPNDWLNLQSTKEFLQELTETRKNGNADFQPIATKRGGTDLTAQGTWMHEDVAMEFARWLSPKFAIWCNDRIKELARTGVTTLAAPAEARDDDEVIAHAMQVLQRRLEAKQLQLQAANDTIAEQTEEIKTLAPLADYTKEVLQSTSTYTLTQVAKDLGFQSIHKFTEWASRHNILYRQSGIWMPYSRFAGKGLFATRTCKYVKTDNTIGTSISCVVTEQGRAMFHELLDRERRQQLLIQQRAQAAQAAMVTAEEGVMA